MIPGLLLAFVGCAVAPSPGANPPLPTNENSTSASTNTHQSQWHSDERQAFLEAQQSGKGVVIDFEAAWCAPCRELNKVLSEPSLFERLKVDFVPLRFDVTEATSVDEKRQSKYAASALPALLFLDSQGKELYRFSGGTIDTASMQIAIDKATMLLRESE